MSKVHFSGIGGTAMVGGAFLALQLGHEVRGSDNPLYPPTSELVKKLNVQVYVGFSKENLSWNPDIVIIGNALSRGNEEVEEVLNKRIPFTSLPEWLRVNILNKRKNIVVSGTHGKTTTTSLISWILKCCGVEPGYLIGGYPKNFEVPAELGSAESFFVIEGDEYDTAFFDKRAKFFHYLPYFLIVTSLEFDHGDIYSSITDIEKAFTLLLRMVPSEGCVFLCGDNHSVFLRDKVYSEVQLYGLNSDCDWTVELGGYSEERVYTKLCVYYRGKKVIRVETTLFGRHNILNVLCAVAMSKYLSLSDKDIKEAVKSFKGVRRRQEAFLEVKERDLKYIDDFAHHPTAIRETLAGIRSRFPGKRLIVVFEPRSNTSVTNIMQGDYEKAFEDADEVVIGPIYRGDKLPKEIKLNRECIVENLSKLGKRALWTDSFDEIFEYITKPEIRGAVVVLMSNGNCGNLRERIVRLYNDTSI